MNNIGFLTLGSIFLITAIVHTFTTFGLVGPEGGHLGSPLIFFGGWIGGIIFLILGMEK